MQRPRAWVLTGRAQGSAICARDPVAIIVSDMIVLVALFKGQDLHTQLGDADWLACLPRGVCRAYADNHASFSLIVKKQRIIKGVCSRGSPCAVPRLTPRLVVQSPFPCTISLKCYTHLISPLRVLMGPLPSPQTLFDPSIVHVLNFFHTKVLRPRLAVG